jgi:antitoxin VapB
MALNIKNAVVERLAAEVAELAGETKTQAVRRALEERKVALERGSVRMTRERMNDFLETLWSRLPADVRGRPISKAEREEILGYGPDGV